MSAAPSRPGLLAAVLPVAAVLAAADTLSVRLALPYRPADVRLFLEAFALWLVFALAATLPAAVMRAIRRRFAPARAPEAEAPFPLLLGWTALPVAAHAVLDRHTVIGNQLLGRVAGLIDPWPWIQVSAVVGGGVVLLWFAARPLQRLGAGRAGLVLTALAVLVGLFLPVGAVRATRRAGVDAAASHSAAAERPNLLLLVWDTCRSDRLGLYGYGRETSPHLARLGQDSLVLEEARSVSVFTFSSHLSLLTGVYPSQHGGRLLSTRYDPRRAETVAARLRDAGYRTGAFVGTDVLAGRTGIRYGFDVYDDRVDPPVCDTHAWKLVHDVQSLLASRFAVFRNNGHPHWFQDFQRPGGEVLARALDWIEERDARPWFCLVNLYDVHWPYTPADADAARLVQPYAGPLDGYLFKSDGWRPGYVPDAEDARHVAELYEAEILGLDDEVSRFLARLDLARTALVVTSDHGEAFGEAGAWNHEDIYEPQVRVPLLVRPAGGLAAPQRRSVPASGIDVAPTLLALAGLEPAPGHEGANLLALLDPAGDATADGRTLLVEDRDHVDAGDVRVALYRGPWKLVRLGLGDAARYRLHDLRTDPVGEVDVGAQHPEVLAELQALLAELRAAGDAADREVEQGSVDNTDALRHLGYVGD